MTLEIEVRSGGRSWPAAWGWTGGVSAYVAECVATMGRLAPRDGVAVIIRRAE